MSIPERSGTGTSDSTVRPWSPLAIMLIAFFLPAGAAVLTIRNLQRLGKIEGTQARELVFATLAIFAVGVSILLLLAPLDRNHVPQLNAGANSVLSAGIALCSYWIQRLPFREWRAKHATTRAAPWLPGVGTALAYTLLTVVVALPIYFCASLIGQGRIA